MIEVKTHPEVKLVGVGWFTFHRMRRVVRDFTLFAVSLFCALWWLENADWRHPVSIQKDLMMRFIHFVKDAVWPYLSKPTDWVLSATFVAIPFVLLAAVVWSFADLLWSLFSSRGSRRYRRPF